jgi:hypothetical protein
MKRIVMIFSVLAAFLVMNALPALSAGTGPYGGFGPSIMGQEVESQHTVVAGGTGPYGAYGPSYKGVDSPLVAFSGGTGPYGVYGPYGMKEGVGSQQIANKDECLLVAINCPPDMAFVQNRIDRLNAEIAKGTDVYTPGELKVLNDKLNAAYDELNKTNSGY